MEAKTNSTAASSKPAVVAPTSPEKMVVAPEKPETMVVSTSAFGKVLVIVKNGFMHIYTMMDGILVQFKVQVKGVYDSLKMKANDRLLFVRSQVLEARLQIYSKLDLVQSKAKAKALQIYSRVQASLETIPVPVKVKNAFAVLETQTGHFVAFVQNGFLKVYGIVGDTCLCMKTKMVSTKQSVEAKALETLSRVLKVIEPYKEKAKSGVLSIKGRVGDTVVAARNKTGEVYGRMAKAIKELPLTKRMTDGITVVQTKVGDIIIYVKDGVLYAVHVVEGNVTCMKARVYEAHGKAKVKIIEKYTETRSMICDATDVAKAKIKAAVDSSKAIASDKPVAASAASGAVLGSAGGGAAGLVAGAACGVPFALFTFGLSIPVGAAIGGGIGAATGAAAGAVGGTAAGYGYEHRGQIKTGVKTGVDGALKKVTSLQDLGTGLKAKLRSSTGSTIQ